MGGGPAGESPLPTVAFGSPRIRGNRIGRIELEHNASQPVINEYPLPVARSHPNSVAIGATAMRISPNWRPAGSAEITPQGQISEIELPVPGPALDIVAGSDGTIWITVPRSHAICRLRPGTAITTFKLPPTAIPAFITEGADGNLYFTEPTGKIARFTPTGALTEFRPSD